MATEPVRDESVLQRLLVGETIAAVTLESLNDGTSYERLTLLTATGRKVVLTTADAEQYSSWLNVNVEADG
jgi:hypothetical protein